MFRVQHRITVNAAEQYKALPRADRKKLREAIIAETGWQRFYFYAKIAGKWSLSESEVAIVRRHFALFAITL